MNGSPHLSFPRLMAMLVVLLLIAVLLSCAGGSADDSPDQGAVSPDGKIGFSPCGNGTLEEEEECESPFGACCDSRTCMFKAAGTECRSTTDPCDLTETCTGSSGTCPDDAFVADGESCPGPGTCKEGVCDASGPRKSPKTGNVLYIPFNDGTAADYSGNEHHGTAQGAQPAPGRYSLGFTFDENDDYVEVSDSPALYVSNMLTIEAWLRRTRANYTSFIYSDSSDSETPNTELTLAVETDGRLSIRSNSGCASKFEMVVSSAAVVLPMDTWTHVALTWDGSSVQFFLDGQRQETLSFGHSPCEKPGTPFRLGQGIDPGNAYGGQMDELKLSDYVKSEAEIQQSMGYDSTVPVCGNGIQESGEACDDDNTASCDGCSADCSATESKQTFYVDSDNDGEGDPDKTVEAYCIGTGRSTTNDDCDDSNAGVHPGAIEICGDGLDNDCVGGDAPCAGGCGNGALEAGEECESPFGPCCDSATCLFKAAGIECRAASVECDQAETCDGSSDSCPGDGFVPAGMPCTDTDTSDCSDAQCDGSGSCDQAHALESDGTGCAGGGTCQGGICQPSGGGGDGLAATYYDNMDFTGIEVSRVDPRVEFNWVEEAPHPSIGADTFSIRWTGFVQAQHSETYTFITRSDDGARLWVDNQLLVDAWVDQGAIEHSGTIALTAGVKVPITMEYYDNQAAALVWLSWSSPSTPKEIVPQGQLFSSPGP